MIDGPWLTLLVIEAAPWLLALAALACLAFMAGTVAQMRKPR